MINLERYPRSPRTR